MILIHSAGHRVREEVGARSRRIWVGQAKYSGSPLGTAKSPSDQLAGQLRPIFRRAKARVRVSGLLGRVKLSSLNVRREHTFLGSEWVLRHRSADVVPDANGGCGSEAVIEKES